MSPTPRNVTPRSATSRSDQERDAVAIEPLGVRSLLRVQRTAGNQAATGLVESAADGSLAWTRQGMVVAQRGGYPAVAELEDDEDYDEEYDDEGEAGEYAPPPAPTLWDFIEGPLSEAEARLTEEAEAARLRAEEEQEVLRKAELEAEAAAKAREEAEERARALEAERRRLDEEARAQEEAAREKEAEDASGEKQEVTPPRTTRKRRKKKAATKQSQASDVPTPVSEPKPKATPPRPEPTQKQQPKAEPKQKPKPKQKQKPKPQPKQKQKSAQQKRHEREQLELQQKRAKEEQERLLAKEKRKAEQEAARRREEEEAARAQASAAQDDSGFERVKSKSEKQREVHLAVDVGALAATIDGHQGAPSAIGETFNRYINGTDAQRGLAAGAVVDAYQTTKERKSGRFSVEVPLPGLAAWVLHAHLDKEGNVATGNNAIHYKRVRDRFATQMSVTLTERQIKALLPSAGECLTAARTFGVPGY